MGYTHYWDMLNHTDEQWREFVVEVGDMLSTTYADTTLVYEFDEPELPAVADDERVRFNGIGDNGHETFSLTRHPRRSFCKTAHKPYDAWVVACLIIGERHGILTWRSDGDDKYDDFSSAHRLLEQHDTAKLEQ